MSDILLTIADVFQIECAAGEPAPVVTLAVADHRADGTTVLRSVETLGPYPRSIVDALAAWAIKTPDTMLIADREGEGWRKLTFAQVLDHIQPLGQALLDAGLSPERPLMILSGNEIEHFLLGMAAIWVGCSATAFSTAARAAGTFFCAR